MQSLWVNWYLFSDGVFAHKDEENETTSEKVDAADDSQDELGGGSAFNLGVITVQEIVDALENPKDSHHSE